MVDLVIRIFMVGIVALITLLSTSLPLLQIAKEEFNPLDNLLLFLFSLSFLGVGIYFLVGLF